MRVLISGAGIAGPTLAYWLNQYGIETTIVERAASFEPAATSSISGAWGSKWPTAWD